MLLARVSFTPHHDHEEAELVAVAEAYLGSMLKNGQICGDYVKGWSEGILLCYARLSHRDAAQHRYLSQWGQKHMAAATLQFGCEPEWEIIDDDVSVRVPTLKTADSVYLFTHAMTVDSPLRHGERGTPLPLHHVPLNDRLRENIFFWQRSFVRHDGLWLDGDALEFSAYQQLADPFSDLSKAGREVCREVEAAIGKPAYYYLVRHWGQSVPESQQPCPACGQPWLADDSPMPSREPFPKFHFRCVPCRIVSHCAVAFVRPEFAEVSQFQPAEPSAEKPAAESE